MSTDVKFKKEDGVTVLTGLITLPEAGKRLGVSRQNAYKMAQREKFKSLVKVENTDIVLVSVLEVNAMASERAAQRAERLEKIFIDI